MMLFMNEYLQYGGMPLAVLQNETNKRDYLKRLFKTTYFSDIIERNKLEKSEMLDELCDVISECSGQLINSKKIENIFNSRKNLKLEKHTIDKYIGYFENSFLISEARRYDIKGNVEIGALRKYYFIDNGLRNARLNFAFNDEGQMLENMVYNELIYNGYQVNVGVLN